MGPDKKQVALPVLDLIDRRFRRALMAFFRRRVRDAAEAEDLTQEVFARMARAGGAELRSTEAYVFQVAANLLRDRGRQLKFRAGQADALEAAEKQRAEAFHAERLLIAKENLQAVIAALKGMNPRRRDIFLLNRLEGLSHDELARMFGISVSAVGKHIYKATAILAQKIGEGHD